MKPDAGREVVVSLRSVRIPIHSEGLSSVPCLCCRKALDIHQPDAELPFRMLATCDECKRWYLVFCDPEGTRALLTQLPEASSVTTPFPD